MYVICIYIYIYLQLAVYIYIYACVLNTQFTIIIAFGYTYLLVGSDLCNLKQQKGTYLFVKTYIYNVYIDI